MSSQDTKNCPQPEAQAPPVVEPGQGPVDPAMGQTQAGAPQPAQAAMGADQACSCEETQEGGYQYGQEGCQEQAQGYAAAMDAPPQAQPAGGPDMMGGPPPQAQPMGSPDAMGGPPPQAQPMGGPPHPQEGCHTAMLGAAYGAMPGMMGGPQPPQPGMMGGPQPPYPGMMGGPQPPQPGMMGGPQPPYPGMMGGPQPPQPGMMGGPQPPYPGMMGGPQPPQPGMMGGPQPPYPGMMGGPQPPYPGMMGGPQPPQPGMMGGPQPPQPGMMGGPQPSHHGSDCRCHEHPMSGMPHAGMMGAPGVDANNQFGQVFGMVTDLMNGKADMSSMAQFLDTSDPRFWKGALVGAALALLLTSSSVKNSISGLMGGLFGSSQDQDEE